MKKIFISLLLFATVAVSAQDVPTSFPRKFLIEHFTGTWCKYCPYGMLALAEYTQTANVPSVWISYHISDTYATSETEGVYSLFAGKDDGVPSMLLNRTKQAQGLLFHPANMLEMKIPDATTAEASVKIDHTYNESTRQLDITVSGQVANTTATAYLLTVAIKENGLISNQSDAFFGWGTSWKEFLHPRIARDILTATAGDKVDITNQTYSKTFTYTLNEKWVAENCCIVAYITPTSKSPVINAEQVAVVENTTGGEQCMPLGITSSKEPSDAEKITFDSIAINKPSAEKLEVLLFSHKTVSHTQYGTLSPVLVLDFNTTESALPCNLFDIKTTNEVNTLTAGYFVAKDMAFYGSRYHYVDPEELQKGIILPIFTWCLQDGKMLVEESGNITLAGNFKYKQHFTMRYVAPTTAVDDITAPTTYVEKFMRNGQVFIRKNGVEYNLLGDIVK